MTSRNSSRRRLPAGRRLVLPTLIPVWRAAGNSSSPCSPSRSPTRPRTRAGRSRSSGTACGRSPAVEAARWPLSQPQRRADEPALPGTGRLPGRARRTRRDLGRRSRGVRRPGRGPASSAPEADGTHQRPETIRAPVRRGASDVRRLRPHAPGSPLAGGRAVRAPPRAPRRARPRRRELAGAPAHRRRGARLLEAARERGPRGHRLQAARQPLPPRQAQRRLAEDTRSPRPGAGSRRLHARARADGAAGSARCSSATGTRRRRRPRRSGAQQKLVYAGGVGTGFTEAMLTRLRGLLKPLVRRDVSFELGEDPRLSEDALRPAAPGRVWSSRCWSARSSSPSGPSRGPSASRRSRACATTRPRVRS